MDEIPVGLFILLFFALAILCFIIGPLAMPM